jgi:hypothetical protein
MPIFRRDARGQADDIEYTPDIAFRRRFPGAHCAGHIPWRSTLETMMKTPAIVLVQLGNARALTQLEPIGPYVEFGLGRSRTPA